MTTTQFHTQATKLLAALKKADVSFPQYMALAALNKAGEKGMSMTEVASEMGHTTAAATGLIDRLEIAKNVARMHSASDRRRIDVFITTSGAKSLLAINIEAGFDE